MHQLIKVIDIQMEGTDKKDQNEIYSNAVRAGKRTYFFDVKATRNNELYLTITESKKRFTDDGKFTFEKHKIFLYREDFEKFINALNTSMDYVNNNSTEPIQQHERNSDYSNVNFEDLNK